MARLIHVCRQAHRLKGATAHHVLLDMLICFSKLDHQFVVKVAF